MSKRGKLPRHEPTARATIGEDATLPACSLEQTLPASAETYARTEVASVEPALGSDATLPAPQGDELGAEPVPYALGYALGGLGDADDEELTGEHAGRYELRAELGEGGIGRVYVALDRHLHREVALKELLTGITEGSTAALPSGSRTGRRTPAELRFVNEARVTGQLEHPGIVPVYELGRRADGTIYYAMRLVRGRTLGKALEGRTLRARLELLPNFVDLCNAVAFAHSRGVVHRDLKPDNVMLGDFDETVVLDWGLAKVRGQKDVQSRALAEQLERLQDSSPLTTVAGLPIGTPSYMPPEQALGEVADIDERSDVYSLGAVLYQLLTGRPPFDGRSALEVVKKAVHDLPERPTKLEPECPVELAAIALRALEKDKRKRYPDASALAHDVRAYLTGGLVGAHRYSPAALLWRWLARHRAMLVAALLVLSTGGGAWFYRGYELARRASREQTQREESTRAKAVAEAERILDQTAQGSTEPRWFETYTFQLISLGEPLARAALEDRLMTALGDSSADVRRLAARSLGGLKSTRAVQALCDRLGAEAEHNDEARIEIINALAIIGDVRAEVPVRDARKRAGQQSRLWEQTALAYRMIPLPPPPAAGLGANDWVERGSALMSKARVDEAVDAYSKAIELDPKLARALNNRAAVYERLGSYRAALADLDRAEALTPNEPVILNNRAGIRRQLEDYEGAIADLDRVLSTGKMDVLALRNRAEVRRLLGELDAALTDQRRALGKAPDDARTLTAMGSVYADLGRWQDALDTFTAAAGPKQDWVDALEQRALVEHAQANDAAALGDLDRAMDLDPSHDAARRLRAVLRLGQGDAAGAKSDVDKCLIGSCQGATEREALRLAQRAIAYYAAIGEWALAQGDLDLAFGHASSPLERAGYALSGAALALRTGSAEAAQGWLGRLEPEAAPPWGQDLVRFVRREISSDELSKRATVPQRRCQLGLALGVRAELEGKPAEALPHYRRTAELPWADELACITAKACADSLAREIGP